MAELLNGGFENGDSSGWITGGSAPEKYTFSVQSATAIEGTYAAFVSHWPEMGVGSSSGGWIHPFTKSSNDVYAKGYMKLIDGTANYGVYITTTSYSIVKNTGDFIQESVNGWEYFHCDISGISDGDYFFILEYEGAGPMVPPFSGCLDGCSIDGALCKVSAKYSIGDAMWKNRFHNPQFESNDLYQWKFICPTGSNVLVQPSTLVGYGQNVCKLTGGGTNTYLTQDMDLSYVSSIHFSVRPITPIESDYVWIAAYVDDTPIYSATHPISETFSTITIALNETYTGTHTIRIGIWEEV